MRSVSPKRDVRDIDNKIAHWEMYNDDDYKIVHNIERDGSIEVYLNAKYEKGTRSSINFTKWVLELHLLKKSDIPH